MHEDFQYLIKKYKILNFQILKVNKQILLWGRIATIDMAIVILKISEAKLELELEHRIAQIVPLNLINYSRWKWIKVLVRLGWVI